MARFLIRSRRRDIEKDTRGIHQIAKRILHALCHRDGHIEMPIAYGVRNGVNPLRVHRGAFECRRIRIHKVKGQLAPIRRESDVVNGHLREIEHESVTFYRTRGAQRVQPRRPRIGGRCQQKRRQKHKDFL